MFTADNLLAYNPDDIPRYLLLRDVLKLDSKAHVLIELKKRILDSELAKKVISQQWEDGSWGRFHSMNTSNNSSFTTEKALRRLLTLGLDKNDEPIIKAVRYMEAYLKDELDLRDYKEKRHDWQLLTRLFVSTWLLRIDSENRLASREAQKWAAVVTEGFTGGAFDERAYIDAYKEILKPEEGKSIWMIQNFYIVSLLSGLLDEKIESSFLDYILHDDKGIYYIYDGRLLTNPQEFQSKQANRYLRAYNLIFDYPTGGQKSQPFVRWLKQNQGEDGFWDMDKVVKDNIHFPLSDSWRKVINRKIDCTVSILRILKKIEKL